MKKLMIILCLSVSATRAQNLPDMPPYDAILHFVAGDIISSTTYQLVQDRKKAFTIAFLSGVGAGVCKEGVDYLRGGVFSLRDVRNTSLGALFATARFKVILNFKARRKGDSSAFENIGPIKEGLFD